MQSATKTRSTEFGGNALCRYSVYTNAHIFSFVGHWLNTSVKGPIKISKGKCVKQIETLAYFKVALSTVV